MEALSTYRQAEPEKIDLDGERLRSGLVKLVLSIVEVLRELLERQAYRRIASGTLSGNDVERLGLAFMQIKQKIREIEEQFGVKPEEVNINLGLLKALPDRSSRSASLVDLIDKVLDKGAVVAGDIVISVADVELLTINLLLTLSSFHRLESSNTVVNLENA